MKPQNHAIQSFLGMQLAKESYSLAEQTAWASIHFSRIECRDNTQFRERIDQENAIVAWCPSVEASAFEITYIEC